MGRINRSTDVRAALRSRQRGFLLNPWRFASGGGSSGIEFVGAVTAGAANTSSTFTISLSGTLTGGLASSPATGDLIVCLSGSVYTLDLTASMSISGDVSGAYNSLAILYANDARDASLSAGYKVQGVSTDTLLTLGKTTVSTVPAAAVVMVFRGVDQTTPLDVTTATATGTNATTINPPAITPVTSGSVIVFGGVGSSGVSSYAGTANTTIKNESASYTAGCVLATYDWVSGVYDPGSVTMTTTTTNDSWCGLSFALRPA